MHIRHPGAAEPFDIELHHALGNVLLSTAQEDTTEGKSQG